MFVYISLYRETLFGLNRYDGVIYREGNGRTSQNLLLYFVRAIVFYLVLQPPGVQLNPRSPQWIGAWWLGYVISAGLLLLSCVALLGFPKEFPGAEQRRQEYIKEGNLPSKDDKIKQNYRDIVPATWQLLKNPIFIFNALALTASTFFAAAIVPFLTKILSLKFDLTPGKAGMIMGIVLTPASIGEYSQLSLKHHQRWIRDVKQIFELLYKTKNLFI